MENNNDYFRYYEGMKNVVQDNYLNDIRILYPWYTDHGIKHSMAIIDTLCDMIAPNNESIDLRNEFYRQGDLPMALSIEDIYILLCAALWHDVGMLVDRDDHGRHLIKFATEIQRYVKDQKVTQCIYDVACAHGSNKKFDDCVNFVPLNFYGKHVDVSKKTLAALLRIADEISEDQNRITKTQEVFDAIPTENRVFWEHAASISYSRYRNHKINLVYSVDIDKVFKKYSCPDGKKITLYRFIIQRVCKIINEMIMCAPLFSSICRIDALHLTIQFQRQRNWICEEVVKEFSEDIRPFLVAESNREQQVKAFFKKYDGFEEKRIKQLLGV